eukprot:COSAG06_NODE_28399_length_575_cov_0.752101_1_plen_27_part_01
MKNLLLPTLPPMLPTSMARGRGSSSSR